MKEMVLSLQWIKSLPDARLKYQLAAREQIRRLRRYLFEQNDELPG